MAVAAPLDRSVAFESAGFTLRGRYWLPATPRTIGVVCCHALGEEKKSTHRSLVLLGAALAEARFPTLMFDYAGCGDSDGDDADGNLEHWQTNIIDAVAWLAADSAVTQIVLLGVRLGGWLALQVAASVASVESIVLWSPLIDLPSYARTLEMQQRMIEITLGFALGTLMRTAEGFDIGGMMVNKTLMDQMRDANLAPRRGMAVVCVDSQPRAQASAELKGIVKQLQRAEYSVESSIVDDEPLRAQVASPERRMLISETVQWIMKRYANHD